MTFYQFMAMTEIDQTLRALESVLIGEREDSHFRILLYQVDSFYVELFCNKHNSIEKLRPFINPDQLEPYLDNITIPFCRY